MIKKSLMSNIGLNILLQITVICSGLIIPHLIINQYGSTVNGMISSITQFLSYITLLESGIGGVIKAALYKPLLRRDKESLGGILNATNQFFRKIAGVFVVYLIVLASTYNKIANTEFS